MFIGAGLCFEAVIYLHSMSIVHGFNSQYELVLFDFKISGVFVS